MDFYGIYMKIIIRKTMTAGLNVTMYFSYFMQLLVLASFCCGNMLIFGLDFQLAWVFSLMAYVIS